MLNRWMRGSVCLLALIVLAGCGSDSQSRIASHVLDAEPVTILSRTSGSDEALKEPGVLLINDAQTLESLGSDKLGQVEVDFNTQSLIVVTLGQSPTGGYWVHLDGVQRTGSVVHVQGSANRPGEQDSVTQAITYPFEAAVVAKVVGQVVPDIRSVEGQQHPADTAE